MGALWLSGSSRPKPRWPSANGSRAASAPGSAAIASRLPICAPPIPEKPEPEIQPSPPTCGPTWRGSLPSISTWPNCSTSTPTTAIGEPHRGGGRGNFLSLREEKRPHIFFTAHLGNFELLPIAAASFGLPVTALFPGAEQPLSGRLHPQDPALVDGRTARLAGGRLLRARPHPRRGGNIGVLVDQKFQRGVSTTFFGRPCLTSPLLPKLARQYDCDVYPARSIRLPGNRYRLIVEDRLELPRTPDGIVDVPATAQLLNDVVERWVREDPAQWMWFHKRWSA
jgi:hypothetical protein